MVERGRRLKKRLPALREYLNKQDISLHSLPARSKKLEALLSLLSRELLPAGPSPPAPTWPARMLVFVERRALTVTLSLLLNVHFRGSLSGGLLSLPLSGGDSMSDSQRQENMRCVVAHGPYLPSPLLRFSPLATVSGLLSLPPLYTPTRPAPSLPKGTGPFCHALLGAGHKSRPSFCLFKLLLPLCTLPDPPLPTFTIFLGFFQFVFLLSTSVISYLHC